MKILIAEDNPIAEKVLRHTLLHFGHDVVSVPTGAAAWELFERDPFRVVVSDWMMPDMDGLELCRRIRSRLETPYTYFILLTATLRSADDFTLAMGEGVDDFLTKPLDREIIRTRLHVAERILRYTTEIQKLQEIIPICCHCKMVRNDDDYWQRIETYITDRVGSQFSHGYCPDCYERQLKALEEVTPVWTDTP
jgi:phosphoserine phosphatase RsbU/P